MADRPSQTIYLVLGFLGAVVVGYVIYMFVT
jgi:uncharacterized integral membrane protein